MPTYDYKCKKCGHHFEEFQRMDEAPLKTCPVCRGEVQRLITGGSGLIFRGSGFYITDYKDSKKGDKKTDLPQNGESSAKSPESDSKSLKDKSKKSKETTSKEE